MHILIIHSTHNTAIIKSQRTKISLLTCRWFADAFFISCKLQSFNFKLNIVDKTKRIWFTNLVAKYGGVLGIRLKACSSLNTAKSLFSTAVSKSTGLETAEPAVHHWPFCSAWDWHCIRHFLPFFCGHARKKIRCMLIWVVFVVCLTFQVFVRPTKTKCYNKYASVWKLLYIRCD